MTPVPSSPLPYAGFIVRHLMQRVYPNRMDKWAAAETEAALDGDRWFWADDNAKILEFMSLPAVWEKYPGEIALIFDFVESLCDGSFIFRRTGHPRLEQLAEEEGRARFVHTFLSIECDLLRGVVGVGMRFHDGRFARNVTLTGNYVQFTHAGTRHSLDIEDAIAGCRIDFRGPDLLLQHRSELHFEHAGATVRLGEIVYGYRFAGSSTFFDVEAELVLDPATEVEDVVLTIAQDEVTQTAFATRYNTIYVEDAEGGTAAFPAGAPQHSTIDAAGARYWSIAQEREMRGFALAIHTLPQEPRTLSSIEVVVRDAGDLHYVIAHHRFPGAHRGATLRAAERKLVTSGGFYSRVGEYGRVLREQAAAAGSAPIDLSISYDYGAELMAFARCHRALSQPGMADIGGDLRARSRALFDRYYAVYADNLLAVQRETGNAIFSRPLSFVTMALVDMWKATGEERYRAALRESVEMLLQFERLFPGLTGELESAFVMAQASDTRPFLDCQAAAILALVRAAGVLDDPALAGSIERALDAIHLVTIRNDFGGISRTDTVAVVYDPPGGERLVLNGFWNFCIGLTLRAVRALRRSGAPALAEVALRQAPRLDMLEAVMERQAARSLRERDGALEVLTSYLSGEGNSETQPWVALGLIDDPADD